MAREKNGDEMNDEEVKEKTDEKRYNPERNSQH